MKQPIRTLGFLWQSCREPEATWFLLCMPLLLLGLQRAPDVGMAMGRLLAVLLVAAALWARGRGPVGLWADRIFVGAWAGCWAAALGALITLGGWPSSRTGEAVLLLSLLVGAGWLSSAVHLRHQLHTARLESRGPGAAPLRSFSQSTIVSAWAVTGLVFAILMVAHRAHWSDLPVLAIAVGCFTTFQRPGLAASEAVESSPSTA